MITFRTTTLALFLSLSAIPLIAQEYLDSSSEPVIEVPPAWLIGVPPEPVIEVPPESIIDVPEEVTDSDANANASPLVDVPELIELGLSAPGSPRHFGSRHRRSSLGATHGSFSSAPNMIGDLFNAGSSALNFGVRVQVDASFTSPATFGTANDLITGFDAALTGVNFTALDNVGDLIAVGDSESVGVADIAPITSAFVRTTDDAATVNNAIANGGTVTPGSPVPFQAIYDASNNAIRTYLPIGFADQVEVQDLATLTYLADESELELSDGPNEVVRASYVYLISSHLPVPNPGETIGRYSIADNNSPMPQDRIFFDYNFFHNAKITAAGIPVNRFAPGFEKTFWDRNASIEMRLPMAVTLTSRVSTDGSNLVNYEVGDLAIAVKTLLLQTDNFVLSCGMGVSLPTARDFVLSLGDDTEVVRIKNDTVHLLPYTAFLIKPSDDTFLQSFAQLDVDTDGNRVFLDEQAFRLQGGDGLLLAGRLRSQTLLRWSTSAGKFLFRDRSGRVKSLAGVMESHYTATLNRAESVGSTNFSIGNPNQTLNVMNLTTGLHAYLEKSVVTVAYGVPVTSDRVFDGELRAFINRYF